MYDDMTNEQENKGCGGSGLSVTLAVLLISAGLIVSGWVVRSVFDLLDGDELPGIAKSLSTKTANQVLVTLPTGEIKLGEGIFVTIGYGIAVALLMIAAIIGVNMFKGGVELLRPNLQKSLLKFAKTLQEQSKK